MDVSKSEDQEKLYVLWISGDEVVQLLKEGKRMLTI